MAAASPGVLAYRSFYESLAMQNENTQPVPYVAESITPNEDLSVWTVKIREGIQFHDGTPVDANIWKLGFDEFLNADGSVVKGSYTTAGLQSVEVTDPMTLVFTLDGPNAAFPEALLGHSGLVFQAEAAMADPNGFGEHPIGTGPFVFDSWTRDDKLIVKRNPNYWQTDGNGNQLPYLDEIEFRPVPDEDVRLQSVLAGDLTVAHSLRQTIVRQAKERAEAGEIAADIRIGNNGGGSIFNTLEPPVDDFRVRQGLAWAINQDDLIEVLGGTGITPPQTQYWSPDSPWFSEDVAAAWPNNDPAKAAELLDDYINDPERSDGKPVGSPISVKFACPGGETTLIELSQLYQAFWQAAGVEVTLETFDQATHIQNALGTADTDPPFRGDFMINCWRMGADSDPFTVFANAFGPVATTPGNFTNFTHPVIDENLEVLRTNTDFDVRYDAVEEIGFLLTEQVPNLWTGGTAKVLFYDTKVHGLNTPMTPDGENAFFPAEFTFWDRVWIEA